MLIARKNKNTSFNMPVNENGIRSYLILETKYALVFQLTYKNKEHNNILIGFFLIYKTIKRDNLQRFNLVHNNQKIYSGFVRDNYCKNEITFSISNFYKNYCLNKEELFIYINETLSKYERDKIQTYIKQLRQNLDNSDGYTFWKASQIESDSIYFEQLEFNNDYEKTNRKNNDSYRYELGGEDFAEPTHWAY